MCVYVFMRGSGRTAGTWRHARTDLCIPTLTAYLMTHLHGV